MSVTNSLEEIVPKLVTRLTKDHGHIRSCVSCTDDVVALSLTSIKPGYSSTDMGRILKRLDADKAGGHTQITVAVLRAIAVVRQNPHHVE